MTEAEVATAAQKRLDAASDDESDDDY